MSHVHSKRPDKPRRDSKKLFAWGSNGLGRFSWRVTGRASPLTRSRLEKQSAPSCSRCWSFLDLVEAYLPVPGRCCLDPAVVQRMSRRQTCIHEHQSIHIWLTGNWLVTGNVTDLSDNLSLFLFRPLEIGIPAMESLVAVDRPVEVMALPGLKCTFSFVMFTLLPLFVRAICTTGRNPCCLYSIYRHLSE